MKKHYKVRMGYLDFIEVFADRFVQRREKVLGEDRYRMMFVFLDMTGFMPWEEGEIVKAIPVCMVDEIVEVKWSC